MKKPSNGPVEHLLESLQERAKELNCLYRVDEILTHGGAHEDAVYRDLLLALPAGWQYPDICQARLIIGRRTYEPADYRPTTWTMSADIQVLGKPAGEVTVSYFEDRPTVRNKSPFLDEEYRLIQAIAERIGLSILQRRLRRDREAWESAVQDLSDKRSESWRVLLDFLDRTDKSLLIRITRKMVTHLSWRGIEEGETLQRESLSFIEAGTDRGENRPLERRTLSETDAWIRHVFETAAGHLSDEDVVDSIQNWINEENSTFLIKSLENPGTGLSELAEAVLRFKNSSIRESELSAAVRTSLRVALIRRFFVDQLNFINITKRFVDVKDFYELVQHLIYPARSQGKLGGKGAGIFLASQILSKATEHADLLKNIKFPKTWYVASDGILDFIQYNTLNEVYNQKYMDKERVRQNYPHIIQVFKNSRFSPEIEKGLASALDDFEDTPLIVRSSSILEDRVGSSFSGKYKSLFLANRGSKRERLEALKDAIAEVYASVFAPDPIEYRAERGLLDFREEMGILIQEVVGKKVGKYFFPAFSGVAFSNNEFRWSPRIRREDGLLRMVPGLGTRAVDRLSNDYPVLLSPGNPSLRVNVNRDETIRYSPRFIDVIDLEENTFVTMDVTALMRECGDEYPLARQLVSIIDGDRLREPRGLEPDWSQDDFVVTFQGLFQRTDFVKQMDTVLKLLQERTEGPVDLEFASDGDHLYIVQCRAQSQLEYQSPVSIPTDLRREKLLFRSTRHISNGRVPEITHVVYVDPDRYSELSSLKTLKDVGRAIGRLNAILPRRKFILIGPGRWGSRGDIKLGVDVTYSDINNTAVLIEVARMKGSYVPELSFGTHFFQDLVEAEICYLPLYPDEDGSVFQEEYLRGARNMLVELLPEFAHLEESVRVVDIPLESGGEVLRVFLNADLPEAVGVVAPPSGTG